ncbi:MAG: glycosyltransferase [Acidobacteriota bacterium]|nr:glycosyltransferase [Acidobacteriota bacterium]
MQHPRVAYFPDSFHEVNGVAHTSRQLVSFAGRHQRPMLCVRAAAAQGESESGSASACGSVQVLELPRGRSAIRVEKDLSFDPLFGRHLNAVRRALEHFQPQVIHITGPSELGFAGAYFAWEMGVPLAASWHTNVHEYAARRLESWSRRLPGGLARGLEGGVQLAAWHSAGAFYRLARVLYAPNAELCAQLQAATGRTCHLMQRGVDTTLFSPARRRRAADDTTLRLGYVGRLSVEKNVALLIEVERELFARGIRDVEFVIVGHGDEQARLRAGLRQAQFTGVLRGEALADAYAAMDLLVFPSHTDTFGNVVLEALASGVPAVVTPDGGPKFIVRHGETGLVARDADFGAAVALLAETVTLRQRMGQAARSYAEGCSWDAVFERVYEGYARAAEGRGEAVWQI